MSASAAESTPAASPTREDAPVTENTKGKDGEQPKPYSKKVAQKKKGKVQEEGNFEFMFANSVYITRRMTFSVIKRI